MPLMRLERNSARELPLGAVRPMPVMTMRLFGIILNIN